MSIDAVRARLAPDADETGRLAAAAQTLEAACDEALRELGVPGRATVQGSVAKGTWIAGSTDLDLFLLLSPGIPQERFESITAAVGARVLQDTRRKYAQHPYVIGRFAGFDVDLVPAYAVPAATSRMSAVDRTPFHTQWVRSHLDEASRSDVRLLKQWCKGTGCYGAETATGGFSGYLLEVLVARFGTFEGALAWFAQGAPGRIALGADEVQDDVSPVVVVDPVDPARNCAAAVTRETVALAADAAKAYQHAPHDGFFFPNPPRAEPVTVLQEAQRRRGETWCGVPLHAQTDRLDLVLPQFQKAARTLAASLARAGFAVHRHSVEVQEPHILLHFVTADETLPAERIHTGPAADAQPNARRFRAKWAAHEDARGPVLEEGGHLVVAVAVRDRRPHEALATAVATGPLGKHVQAALQGTLWDSLADADDRFMAAVSELVLDRRPWER